MNMGPWKFINPRYTGTYVGPRHSSIPGGTQEHVALDIHQSQAGTQEHMWALDIHQSQVNMNMGPWPFISSSYSTIYAVYHGIFIYITTICRQENGALDFL